MRDSYSLYEAKARLSALIRQVREGRRITVTVHGEPVAEIGPVTKAGEGIEQRLRRLQERGVLVPGESGVKLRPQARRPGALRRFLADRD